jgi:DNA-binding NarL/FixJ family response regulator
LAGVGYLHFQAGGSILVASKVRWDADSGGGVNVGALAAKEEPVVRVLIVDDQEPFRLAARMVVEATEGFEVVGEAETGERSVEMARELDPDLVLMDVNLPGINGLDATRKILETSKRVVILLLSTYEEEEYAPRAAECGASAYIPKSSFGPDRLAGAWADANGSPA